MSPRWLSPGTMAGSEEFRFVCPECGERIAVNGAMRQALLENGCVICGAPLTDQCFT